MIVLFVDLEEYSSDILHVVMQKATVLGRPFQANALQREEVVFLPIQ